MVLKLNKPVKPLLTEESEDCAPQLGIIIGTCNHAISYYR